MIKTTPFHERLSELNTTGLYGHWSGYLSAQRYDTSAKHEYFGIRNSAGFFDTSPLYKHWIRGKDAERFLAGVMTRDIRTCRPGRAQYTVWCDDAGYILEDGVLFRHSDNEFLLTCAEPNVGYLRDLVGRLQVEIEDVSDAARHPGPAGPALARDPRAARPRGHRPAVLRPGQHQDRQGARHHLAHRLHRRPRLRDQRPGRRRHRGARRS